eukprot:TRINITY_DN4762_c0_g8_i1.p1 TRINITY_DN4762_c0_g8~~TRINITY_DN4762_c0_g8_i1.p1  ORF type:complete len:202 (-),score=42.47 TRINITY_DN4762_c0_g8_i1:1398-2003(-)
MLSNLPVSKMSEEEMTTTFSNDIQRAMFGVVKDPATTFRVVYSYDVTEFTKLTDQLTKLRRDRARLKHASTNSTELRKIDSEMKGLQKRLNKMVRPENLKRLGIAYVTFDFTIADDVLEKYKPSVLTAICNCSKYRMKGASVTVEEAPEPEDIRWENLSYTRMGRLCRAIINWIITIFILGICLVANIFINKKNVLCLLTQ